MKRTKLITQTDTLNVILDVADEHIAMIDQDGFIIAVNRAWRQFAHENHAPENVFEGANYLEICDRSANNDAPYAADFAIGLRAVICGRQKSFSMEYPCHSPDEERWFTVEATRIDHRGTPLVVISHKNITDKKNIETQFENIEKLNQLVLSNISDAVFLTDEAGRFVFVCPNVYTIFGYSHEEVMTFDTIHAILGDVPFNPDTLAKQGEITNIEHWVSDKDGQKHLLLVNVKQVELNHGTRLYTYRDITDYNQVKAKLIETQERYTTLFERSQDAVYIHDFEGNFLDANPAALEMLGYTHTELTELTFDELLSPDEKLKAFKQMESLYETGVQDKVAEYALRTKKNRTIFVETMSAILYQNGQPRAVQGIARDITEKIRTQAFEYEQRLIADTLHRTSQSLLSKTLDIDALLKQILSDVTDIIPSDFATIMLVESNIATVVHWKSHSNYNLPDISELQFDIIATRNLREMAETGNPLQIDDTYEYAGWNFQESLFDKPVRSCIGAPIGIGDKLIGFLTLNSMMPDNFTNQHLNLLQITADRSAIAIENAHLHNDLRIYNKQLEQRVIERTYALQQEKNRLKAVLDNTADAIVIINRQGKIREYNPAFKKAFMTDDMEKPQRIVDCIPEDQQDEWSKAIKRVAELRDPQRLELYMEAFEQVFTFDVFLSCVQFENSREVEIICSLRDITALKAAKNQLKHALDQERELNEAKTAFTSMISHEFRTPLSVIHASSELLLEYHDRLSLEKRQKRLKKITEQVHRLRKMMDDIVFVSKADARELPFEPGPTEVYSLCTDILEDVRFMYGDKVKIDFSTRDIDRLLLLDKNLFRHILQNLLSNALKYSPAVFASSCS